jgi:hypothetical protein
MIERTDNFLPLPQPVFGAQLRCVQQAAARVQARRLMDTFLTNEQ